MDFIDCMECYGAGRAAMTIEPANEASILYDEGGAVGRGRDGARCPAGPLGTRHAGSTPPLRDPFARLVQARGMGARQVPLRSRADARRRPVAAASSRSRATRSSTTRVRSPLPARTAVPRRSGHGRSPAASDRSRTTGWRSEPDRRPDRPRADPGARPRRRWRGGADGRRARPAPVTRSPAGRRMWLVACRGIPARCSEFARAADRRRYPLLARCGSTPRSSSLARHCSPPPRCRPTITGRDCSAS